MEILIVFLPLFGAMIVGLNSTRIAPIYAQIITSGLLVISAILSLFLYADIIFAGTARTVVLDEWLSSGTLSVNWALKFDSLTATMLVVVTAVSALVHIYSIGYMSHDPHIPRFMAYLSLFTFFMLMLVTSDNFLQLFLGWEGVGLCSYLLIGFWYKKESANLAAMKAFIVNRVGDLGLALGIFAIYWMFGTITYDEVFAKVGEFTEHTLVFLGMEFHAITLICILLFIGCMGKSAQLGLHTWLPDAMEGPTPVSALIHAATMVTAGVFLVARCSPLFEHAPLARDMVTIIGAFTAIFAATIAMTQHDIKRVIAYSTCSQLGYMFFACGVSAYSAGIFHLMTHGFFKALLFLGAGSVIHAMSDEQDMRKMGGLYNKIPMTYAMMLIGTLAITGIPWLSGYYSKDMILEAAYASGEHGAGYGALAYYIGVLTALLTSFYSWRLIFLTFHGKTRASREVLTHIHESPLVMMIPLIILSLGAIFAGYLVAEQYGIIDPSLKYWGSSIVMLAEHNVLEAAHHVPEWVPQLIMAAAIGGGVIAAIVYLAIPGFADRFVSIVSGVHRFFYRKWYVDELYDAVFVKPARAVGYALWQYGDIGFIDRFGPNGFAASFKKFSAKLSQIQSGLVYHYAFAMLIGLVGLVSWICWKVGM